MNTTLYSAALFAPVLLLVGGLTQAAQAQATPQNTRVQELYEQLQEAVCQNDWTASIHAINALIGTSDLPATYRQQLVSYRRQLQDWRAAQSFFASNSSCGTPIAVTAVGRTVTFSQSRVATVDRSTLQDLYASLQGAVCQSDWNRALQVTGRLMGSPDITPAYREQLVQFRYQLQDWRASRATLANAPDCNRIARSTPVPEMGDRPMDWATPSAPGDRWS